MGAVIERQRPPGPRQLRRARRCRHLVCVLLLATAGLVVFAPGLDRAAGTTATAGGAARARTIDWADPGQRVSYRGGWSAGVCAPNVPIICVERDGTAVGIVEVGAFPLDPAVDPEQLARRPRRYLATLVADFNASHLEDRAVVCGPDYVVDLDPAARRQVLRADGLTFGYRGNFAGEPVSERGIISLAVVDGRVISVGTSAHDPTSCYAGESAFTTADLDAFEPHLRRLVRTLPVPSFLWDGGPAGPAAAGEAAGSP